MILSLIAICSLVIHINYPNLVNKLDQAIPDYYGTKIKSLHSKAKESKTEVIKFEYFDRLYSELENVSVLNKYYYLRQKSAIYLINYYLKSNKKQTALTIAKKWMVSYPYDFLGKFKYIDTLSQIDLEKSLVYYDLLFDKHFDIHEVQKGYKSFLLKHNQYNRLLKLSNSSKYDIHFDHSFRVFYKDRKQHFSEKDSKAFNKKLISFSFGLYKIKFTKKFSNFKGIRFDLDRLPKNTVISDLKVVAFKSNLKIGLNILRTNQLISTNDGRYRTNGNDPHFIFAIPEELKNHSGNLTVEFEVKIDKVPKIDNLIKSGRWELLYSNKNQIDLNVVTQIDLKRVNNQFYSSNLENLSKISQIKVNLPKLKGLKIANIILELNKKNIFTKKHIAFSSGIKFHTDYFELSGDDPSVTFNLGEDYDIKETKFEVIFDVE